jgi:hypothetical protein
MSTTACEEWFERREFADWPTFDDFVIHSRKMRFIKINDNNYKLSECSCTTWFKYDYKCKHSIDLCSRLGLFNYEDRVRNLPIGVNRRRGNPGKTKSALTFQPNEIAETILSGSESEHNATTSKSKKKGAKSKKDTKDSSSDSDESDFDIFATATTATTS